MKKLMETQRLEVLILMKLMKKTMMMMMKRKTKMTRMKIW
jgi:hypothetical protein